MEPELLFELPVPELLLEELLSDELLELLESLVFSELDELSELVVSDFLESVLSEEESLESVDLLDSSVFSLEELESSFIIRRIAGIRSFSVTTGVVLTFGPKTGSVGDIAEEHGVKNDGRMVKIIEIMVTIVSALTRLRESFGARFTCDDCPAVEAALE